MVIIVVLAAVRSGREEATVHSSGSTTSAPPVSAPTEPEHEGVDPENGESGNADESDGRALPAPVITGIAVNCAPVAPADRPPCSVTPRWTDPATDETGYRVELTSRIAGSITMDLPADSTLYNRLFEVDDSICITVFVVRDEEVAASDEECVTT